MIFKSKKLSELCDIQLGGTPYRKNPNFWDKEKLTNNVWLSISDLKHGEYVEDSSEYLSDEGKERVNVTPEGTLMLSFKLTIGRCSFAKIDLRTNEAIASLLNLSDEIDKKYLFYYFSFLNWDEVSGNDIKVKGKTLNKKKLKNITIKYPNIIKQKLIVEKLDTCMELIDKAIQNVEQNIQNTEELFQSYLNEIFSQKNDLWINSELGKIYDVRDGTHDSPKYQSEGYPLVTSKNLKNGKIVLNRIKYISFNDYNNINKRSRVDVGDVLFAMIGTIGNPVVIIEEPNFAIKNVALFKVSKTQNSHFLKYFLDLDIVRNKMQVDAKGSTQKFVGLGYLRRFRIDIPSKEIQDYLVSKINEFKTKNDLVFSNYKLELDSLNNLKKSILEKVFNEEL